MKEFTLSIQNRAEKGSAAVRRYRKQGMVPSVFYGRGQGSLHGLVSDREFRHIAKQVRTSQVFKFKSDVSDLNGRSGIVKEVQQDHVNGRLLHVDFQILNENEEIHIKIPVKIVGEAPGVKLEAGILTVVHHELPISCLPKYIPEFLEVSIASLNLGQSIHVRDVALPEGVTVNLDEDESVVSVVAARSTKLEEEEAAASAEGAAGASEGAAAKAEEPAGKEKESKSK